MKKAYSSLARVLALMLVMVMAIGICTVGAGAATLNHAKHYDTYLCLGDSIAAGYGPYEGFEKIKGFERVDVAYHAMVADAVTADTFYPLARTGFRTHEIRYMLEQGYEGDDYMFLIANLKPDVVAEWKPVFEKAVKEADLVTLNVGSNDVMNYAYYRAYLAGNDSSDSELSQRVSEVLANAGGMGEAIQKLLEGAKSAGKLPVVVNAFIEGLFEGYQHFRENWDPLVKDILDANPNVTLVTVGMFNPIKTAKLTDISLLHIGRVFDTVVQLMNQTMQHSQYADRYLYADVMDTETFELEPLTADTFGTTMIARVHPTEEGHQYMATQIVKLLPTKSEEPQPTAEPSAKPTAQPTAQPTTQPTPKPTTEPTKKFPFTDVKADAWYYPNVYYVWDQGLMQGKSASIFDPEGTTTRAEFAAVIYRMAGSPEVSKADYTKCPFTDMTAEWYMDAAVWAYNNGIIRGTSETTFSPDNQITREQMVAILYRCSKAADAQGDLSKITDAASISDYAKPAVAWAVKNGVISGFEDGTFRPQGNATRAQMAAIMNRFDQLKK